MKQNRYCRYWDKRACLMFVALASLLGHLACSVKTNNAATRIYHNLTTRYNVYYNANNLFNEVHLRSLEGQVESYTEPIAFDPIVYRLASLSDGSSLGLFDQAIKKADKAIKEHSLRSKPKRKAGWHKDPKQRAEQAKTEYNSVLYKAWMLRGQAQLYNGQLQEAFSTFDYISRLYNTQDEVRVPALLWQIKCLSLSKRPAEARELFAQIDSLKFEKTSLYMGVRAEHHLAMGDTSRAIHWLERYVPYSKPRSQRMRLYYLLGQLYQARGREEKAFEAYRKVLSFSPPPALEFAARLRSAELTPGGQARVQAILERMGQRQRYREYLDQIYYALGNNYLSSLDTVKALRAFSLAADSSQHKGQDYALALLAQGDIWMARREYVLAADKYQSALMSLSQEDNRYPRLKALTEGLEKLRPSVVSVVQGDSLLRLARSPESYRLRVIDSLISALHEQEVQAAKQRARDSVAQAGRELASRLPGALQPSTPSPSTTNLGIAGDSRFYFYNPNLLREGARAFERYWGKRPLVDLWRLSKKPNILDAAPASETEDPRQEIVGEGASTSLGELQATDADEPEIYTRDYYLRQLPLSSEAQTSMEAKIEQAMLAMGQVLTADLELLPDAVAIYEQLLSRYPQGLGREEALFSLYMLSLRMRAEVEAERYKALYLSAYRTTERGKELAQGNYIERLKSRDREVRIAYQSVYEAYWGGRLGEVQRGVKKIEELASGSTHAWQAKFLLAMSYATQGDSQRFREILEAIAQGSAPEDVATLTRDILSGLQAGKPLFAGHPRSIDWDNLSETSLDSGANQSYSLTTKGSRLVYLFVAPATESLDALTFHLSYYNYSEYTQVLISVRPLALSPDLYVLRVGSFATLDDAQTYRAGWERYRSKYEGLGVLLIPVLSENTERITTKQSLINYLRQMDKLDLGGLYSSGLQREALELLQSMPQTSPLPSNDRGSVLNFGINLDGESPSVSEPQVNHIETSDEGRGASISQDRLLSEPPLTYDQVQARQKMLEKQKREQLKERERQRKADLKARERMQREVQRDRERLRRERDKERGRQRKERDRERFKAARGKR